MSLVAYARPACSFSHVSAFLMLLKDLFDALAINAIIMHCKFSAKIAAVWYTTEAEGACRQVH